MAKSFKKIANDSVKKSRVKTKADEIYNERRRAKRAKERVERKIKEGQFTGKDLGNAIQYVNSLTETINLSYAQKTESGRKEYPEYIGKVRETLKSSSKTEIRTQDEVERINKIWKRNINQATKKDGVSPLSESEVRAFFRTTRVLWDVKGVDITNRLETIMQELGVSTIKDAFELIKQSKYYKEIERDKKDVKNGKRDEKDNKYAEEATIQMNEISQAFRERGISIFYETE